MSRTSHAWSVVIFLIKADASQILALSGGLGWITIMWFARGFWVLGPLVVALQHCFGVVFKMALLWCTLIIGFAVAFNVVTLVRQSCAVTLLGNRSMGDLLDAERFDLS